MCENYEPEAENATPAAPKIPTGTTPRDQTLRMIEDIALSHGLTLQIVLGRRSDRPVVAARYQAMQAVRQARPEMSMPAIGTLFDRDRSTVEHALGRRKNRAAANGKMCEIVLPAELTP